MHCLLSGRAWEQEVGRDVYREVKMCTFGVYLVVADRVFQIGQVGCGETVLSRSGNLPISSIKSVPV